MYLDKEYFAHWGVTEETCHNPLRYFLRRYTVGVELTREVIQATLRSDAASALPWLRTVGVTPLDVSGLDLSNLDMTGWNVSDWDMTGTNCTNSTLRRACLHRVNMTRAIFDGSDLSSAHILFCTLHETSMRNTDLRYSVWSKLLHGDDVDILGSATEGIYYGNI